MMESTWEAVFINLERPEQLPTLRTFRDSRPETPARQAFYVAAERAFREALLAATDSMDVKSIAAAAERLSNALALVRVHGEARYLADRNLQTVHVVTRENEAGSAVMALTGTGR